MEIGATGSGTRQVRSWFVRLLLIAVLFRALIPQGYMPDVSAGADGLIKFVICSGSGIGGKVVSLDGDGKPAGGDQPSHIGEPCVFAASLHVALPILASADVPKPEFVAIASPQHAEAVLPPVRAGPQLGSRGPPLYS